MSRASLKRRARFLHARKQKGRIRIIKKAIASTAIVSISIREKKSRARKCSLLLFAADSFGMFS